MRSQRTPPAYTHPVSPPNQDEPIVERWPHRDVSYKPTAHELRFLETLQTLAVSSISKAEAECVIRKTIKNGRVNAPEDRRRITDCAKRFGIDRTFQ